MAELIVVTWNVWFDVLEATARHTALLAEALAQKPHLICLQVIPD